MMLNCVNCIYLTNMILTHPCCNLRLCTVLHQTVIIIDCRTYGHLNLLLCKISPPCISYFPRYFCYNPVSYKRLRLSVFIARCFTPNQVEDLINFCSCRKSQRDIQTKFILFHFILFVFCGARSTCPGHYTLFTCTIMLTT